MTALRDLASRPARTFFTVAGIAIGILALTVVGSLAERLHTIVARSTALNSDVVFATIRRSALLGPRAHETVERAYAKLKALDGVRAAVPEVIVPYEGAQDLLRQTVPPTIDALPGDPVSAFMVVAKQNADVGLLARRIAFIDGLSARDPREVANAVKSTLGIFDAIVFGAALIALLVGAFSVINTMTIAVTERTREIGIRKAIGATDGSILLTFVGEAATIGALGGLVGIMLGLAVVTAIDARSAAGGNLQLFAISPVVGLGAFAFSVALSAVAGFVPALSAARLPPTVALRR